MNLFSANILAQHICTELEPYCEPECCVIAGSIRRKRPAPNDIDLVVLPTDRARLLARAKLRTTVLSEGEQNVMLRMANGIDLDIFFAKSSDRDLIGVNPTNFGSVLVCRTGSMDFNIWLAGRARSMGMQWHPYIGIIRGNKILASETEASIFRALNLDYIAPEDREK